MIKNIKFWTVKSPLILLLALLGSCVNDSGLVGDDSSLTAINITADYPTTTRATDAGFGDGDVMGIHVVDYDGESAGVLSSSGNNSTNVAFTYSESSSSWSGVESIYFKSDYTNVDVYGYYPYDSELNDVNSYNFKISKDQSSTSSGYEASDLLWAKSSNISASSPSVTLSYQHLMAGVTITLKEGDGFSDSEWNTLTKAVVIKNSVADCSVDLSNGSVALSGNSVADITPYLYNGEYKGIVAPQTISAGVDLLNVMIDKIDYTLSKDVAIEFQSGKMHTFTVEVDKRETSGDYELFIVDEAITSWIVDAEFYDGVVKEYVVVNVEKSGTLESVVAEMGLVYDEVTALKITGEINDTDMSFVTGNLINCKYLNLGDSEYTTYGREDNSDKVTMSADFSEYNLLSQIIFPNNVERLSWKTPGSTGLTGSFVIPEGIIELVAYNLYSSNMLIGELTLPSTLKIIGYGAFQGSKFTGTLTLPDGLTYIGKYAFSHTNFSGTLELPNGVEICSGAFSNMPNIRGDIIIPDGVEVLDGGSIYWGEYTGGAFAGSGFDGNVHLPEGLKRVGINTFFGTNICGEVDLPESLLSIEVGAFGNTKITNVILPDNLSIIGENAFKNCTRLSSDIVISKNIYAIPEACFSGCSMIPSITLHENVTSIGKEAFAYCNLLTSIVCMAETPPFLGENAFYGVSIDDVTLEVPASAIEAYKRADGWKEFSRITEYSDFVCRPLDVCALNTAKEMEIILNADAAWSVETMPDWCAISQTSGTSKTSIMLAIDEMAQGAGDRVGVITFKSTSDEGNEVTTSCTISQYDYQYAENEVVTLQSATKGKGVNVIFLGEGYDAASIADGSYMSMIEEQTANFFGIEPFTTYRDYFTVKAAVSLSQETGVNTMSTYRDICFETVYGGTDYVSCCCSTISTSKMVVDESIIFDYLDEYNSTSRDELTETLIIMVPNTTDYDGVTYIYDDGCTISICPPNESTYPSDTRGMLQKQACGFGFGKLGDEEIVKNAYIKESYQNQITSAQQRGYYQNLSLSGMMSEVPWSDLIFDERYSDVVDLYEGGYFFTKGIYRAEINSCMNYGIPYFNTISRREIVKRIGMYSGEWNWWDTDTFYQNDSREWGASSNSSSN